MANEQELIETLRRNTKAQQSLTEAINRQADALTLQATALHALADSLASCTTEDVERQEEAAETHAGPTYADGTPMGDGVPQVGARRGRNVK